MPDMRRNGFRSAPTVAGAGLAFSDRVKDAFDSLAPVGSARRVACDGAVAGLVGTVAMTAGAKVEQALTGRPGSSVPARTLPEPSAG